MKKKRHVKKYQLKKKYKKLLIKKIEQQVKHDFYLITKEDINETHNYNFFTISSLNTEKEIYNINTIENINVLFKKIDELKNQKR